MKMIKTNFTWFLSIHCLLLFLTINSAKAVDPNRYISQYGHTAWRMQDGVFNSTPNVIAQTTDGFIWIGTQAGLVRFDGSRFVSATTTSSGQPIPDVKITSLRRARDGSLWIGTPYGLSRLKDGELITYSTAIGSAPSSKTTKGPSGSHGIASPTEKAHSVAQLIESFSVTARTRAFLLRMASG
jgi:ligand-binding sensor domain-containing protein